MGRKTPKPTGRKVAALNADSLIELNALYENLVAVQDVLLDAAMNKSDILDKNRKIVEASNALNHIGLKMRAIEAKMRAIDEICVEDARRGSYDK